MYLRINRIAIFFSVFEHQFAITPIATHTFHADAVAVVHQPFWEETGEVADAAHNVAAEKVIGVAHTEYPIGLALIGYHLHSIHMHHKAFCTYLDFPFIAFFSLVIIQHSELTKNLVPPIQLAIAFIDIFVRYVLMQILVVKRVDFHKDMRCVIVDYGVAGLIHVLVSNATILILDFVIPFVSDNILDKVLELTPIRCILISLFAANRHMDGNVGIVEINGTITSESVLVKFRRCWIAGIDFAETSVSENIVLNIGDRCRNFQNASEILTIGKSGAEEMGHSIPQVKVGEQAMVKRHIMNGSHRVGDNQRSRKGGFRENGMIDGAQRLGDSKFTSEVGAILKSPCPYICH